MRHLGTARRAGVLTATAAAGVLCAAGPAVADVTVSPSSAAQGSGANLTFHVTNTAPQPVTRVTLRLPADTPVAEVYPLSVDDWAPQISTRRLSTPLATIHGGTPVEQTADAITWIAVGGARIAPGASADLSVAIGPLPALSSMRFTVEAAYADGAPAPAMPPATLTLSPADGAPAAGHHEAQQQPPSDEDAAFAALAASARESDGGPSTGAIAGWLAAAIAALVAAWLAVRGRHRADDEPGDPGEPDDEPAGESGRPAGDTGREPVAAGRWSLRG